MTDDAWRRRREGRVDNAAVDSPTADCDYREVSAPPCNHPGKAAACRIHDAICASSAATASPTRERQIRAMAEAHD